MLPQGSAPIRVVYDTSCRFCVRNADRLVRLARPGAAVLVSSNDPGLVRERPEVAHLAATRAMQAIEPDGRVHSGVDALASVLNTRPVWRAVTWLVRVPPFRQLAQAGYWVIARYRHRLAWAVGGDAGGTCPDGTCSRRG